MLGRVAFVALPPGDERMTGDGLISRASDAGTDAGVAAGGLVLGENNLVSSMCVGAAVRRRDSAAEGETWAIAQVCGKPTYLARRRLSRW